MCPIGQRNKQTKTSMQTLASDFKSGHGIYFGERGDWLIALAIHRDSDALSRSNWRVMEKILRELPEVKEWQGEFSPVATERASHWAVGWVDYLVIDPACTAAIASAEEMREQIDNYPVLDEEDFSREEQEEAESMWRDCYCPKERVKYIREHRSQFEFRGLADLLSCVRGKYFSGYACELLN